MNAQGKAWLDRHNACMFAREALEQYASLEDAFLHYNNWEHWMWSIDRIPNLLTHQELILFAVFCARQNLHLLSDPHSKYAIDVAARTAYGLATDDEIRLAIRAATDVYAVTYAAAAADAAYAARAAILTALHRGVYTNAFDITPSAACAAARAATRAAACTQDDTSNTCRQAQLDWLRANVKPNFNYN